MMSDDGDLEENPPDSLSAESPISVTISSTGADPRSRTESEKSLDAPAREAAMVLFTTKTKDPIKHGSTRSYVSEENLIHNNEWVEENLRNTDNVRLQPVVYIFLGIVSYAYLICDLTHFQEGDPTTNPICSKPICKKIKNCYESKVSTYMIFAGMLVDLWCFFSC